MKKMTWGLLLLIFVILCGCRKNDLDEILNGILINDDEEIAESFFLPKYIEGREDIVINWVSSDERIIIIDENEDGSNYKAIVRLPAFAVEMELIATISNGEDHFEKSYFVMIAKDDYRKIDIDEINNQENGELVKLDVVVIFSEDNLYAVGDDTDVLIFKDNHNYQVGDNLIMKLKVNHDSFDIDSIELISKNNNYYPYRNVELISILEVYKIKNEQFIEDSLYRVIGEVNLVNNQYYLTNPNAIHEFIVLINGNDVSSYQGKLVECLVLITNDKYDLTQISITNVYTDYQYYYKDYEKVDEIIDDINDAFKGIITNDFILPKYDNYNPEIEWSMPGYDISYGKIIHPQTVISTFIEVKVQIGEAIIYEKIDIVFVKGVLMTISEAKEAFLINGKSIILVEGVVTELGESYAILSDGKNELIVSGLTNIKVDEWIYIRGEILNINSIRSFDLLR